MPPADTETKGKRENNEKGHRHKWGSGLRFRRRATPATASNGLPPRAGTERREARERSGTVGRRVRRRLDEGGRRRPRPAVLDSPPRTPNPSEDPATFEREQLKIRTSPFSPLLTVEHGWERRVRTSRPTREAASRWAAAGASSGGRSRHTAAARRLTEEEGGSPRGLSAPALPSPPGAAQRRCGVSGPPRRAAPAPAAGVVGRVALSGRRRRRRRGGAGGAEEAAAGREAGGIGWDLLR